MKSKSSLTGAYLSGREVAASSTPNRAESCAAGTRKASARQGVPRKRKAGAHAQTSKSDVRLSGPAKPPEKWAKVKGHGNRCEIRKTPDVPRPAPLVVGTSRAQASGK